MSLGLPWFCLGLFSSRVWLETGGCEEGRSEGISPVSFSASGSIPGHCCVPSGAPATTRPLFLLVPDAYGQPPLVGSRLCPSNPRDESGFLPFPISSYLTLCSFVFLNTFCHIKSPLLNEPSTGVGSICPIGRCIVQAPFGSAYYLPFSSLSSR